MTTKTYDSNINFSVKNQNQFHPSAYQRLLTVAK